MKPFLFLQIIVLMLAASDAKAQRASDRDSLLYQYALATPPDSALSVKSLANYLVKPTQNDYEKARIIFAWVAQHIQYDLRAINKEKTSNCAANLVLKKKKAYSLGISMLYEALAVEAGLNARTIIGYGKSSLASKNKKIRNPNHVWNAVLIDDSWRLVDASSGGGYLLIKGKNYSSKRVFNPFWFDTDPRIFIYTHLPDIPKWQLLPNTIDLKTFKIMPFISNTFIQKGFTIDGIYEQSCADPKAGVVQIYEVKKEWHLLEAPFEGQLLEGNKYSCSIRSGFYHKAIVFTGDAIYKCKSTDGLMNITFEPDGKDVRVALYKTESTKQGEIILVYKTKRLTKK